MVSFTVYSVVIFSYRYLDSDRINVRNFCIPGCILAHLNTILYNTDIKVQFFFFKWSFHNVKVNNVFKFLQSFVLIHSLTVSICQTIYVFIKSSTGINNQPVNSTISVTCFSPHMLPEETFGLLQNTLREGASTLALLDNIILPFVHERYEKRAYFRMRYECNWCKQNTNGEKRGDFKWILEYWDHRQDASREMKTLHNLRYSNFILI